ncbi:MAG: peptidoglycan D,D-transpeptidase FtsI family protein [Acidimicrobiales bacterium]
MSSSGRLAKPARESGRRSARPGDRPRSFRAPFRRRVVLFKVMLVLAVLAVSARLVAVQVLESPKYKALGASELTVTVADPGLRGAIYDRNGEVLAMSVPTKTVVADDFQIRHPASEAAVLAPILKSSPATLAAQLKERSGYVRLASNLSATLGQKLAADDLPGITLLDSSRRVDPDGPLALPLLGELHASGAGAFGIEYQHNGLLSGKAGKQTLLESPAGVDLPQGAALTRSAGEDGESIELTIDQPLQYMAESLLGDEVAASHATSGTAVVMDVKTGDVLAMANVVAGSAGLGAVPGVGAAVSESPSNLAVTQAYEPGSVFKLVTFSAALADGVIGPDTSFTVPDSIQLDGSTFHDAELHPTETLNATQILAQSSNIGTGEIAHALGENRLLAQVQALGFGTATSLEFPGQNPGILAGPSQWEPTNIVSLPIGQVDAVTPLQVLDAYNTVANGGVFVEPRLVASTIDRDGKTVPSKASATHRVLSSSVDQELTQMLEQVVLSGTGVGAAIPGYSVMGKTGTAQIPAPGADAYIPGAYMATFVGSAPADNPVLSAIVVLNHPEPIYGGTVAAPVFAQIMGYALHRYGVPATPGASSQPQSPPTAADQAQDVT